MGSTKEPATTPRLRALHWIAPLLLAAVAFAPGLGGGFVQDDPLAIERNPVVTGEVGAGEAFTRNFWGRALTEQPPSYRPLTTLAFRVDYWLFGPSPLALHVVSLAVYLLLVHLAQRLARRSMEPLAATLATSLFAVLAVHTENVASLVGRADALALCAMIGALLAAGREADDSRARSLVRLVAVGALTAAALGFKESAVVLPALLFLVVLPRLPKGAGPVGWLRALGPALVSLAVVASYLGARAALFPSAVGGYFAPDDVLAGASAFDRVRHGLELLARYAELLAAPVDLCAGRKYAEVCAPSDTAVGWALGGAALLGLALVIVVRDLRGRRVSFIAAALVAWSVFSSVLVSVPEAMAERFLLGPSLFLCIAVGPLLERAVARRLGAAALGIVFASQLGLAAFHATRWRSDLVLFEHAVTACPRSVHNHYRLATLLARSGRVPDALWHFAVAGELRRRFPRRAEHPNEDAEATVPIETRLSRLHALLRVDVPEPVWRARLGAFLRSDGQHRAAALLERLPASAP